MYAATGSPPVNYSFTAQNTTTGGWYGSGPYTDGSSWVEEIQPYTQPVVQPFNQPIYQDYVPWIPLGSPPNPKVVPEGPDLVDSFDWLRKVIEREEEKQFKRIIQKEADERAPEKAPKASKLRKFDPTRRVRRKIK